MAFPKVFYFIWGKLSWRNVFRSQGSAVFDDLLVRFLTTNSQFTASTGRIRSSAFLPSPQDLKLSVYEIIGLFPRQIWKLGRMYVGRPSGRNVRARADLSHPAVAAAGLATERDGSPRRHVSITGWQTSKEDQKDRALVLAQNARLVLAPD